MCFNAFIYIYIYIYMFFLIVHWSCSISIIYDVFHRLSDSV